MNHLTHQRRKEDRPALRLVMDFEPQANAELQNLVRQSRLSAALGADQMLIRAGILSELEQLKNRMSELRQRLVATTVL